MASFRKRGKIWYYRFVDADGVRQERKGCADKRKTEEIARHVESEAASVKAGLVDPRDVARRDHARKPIEVHLAAYEEHLKATDKTARHVKQAMQQARDLASASGVNRLTDLDGERVQAALANLKAGGSSHWTCNHYRKSLKAFTKWCVQSGRLAFDPLFGVVGFNPEEDVRRDRRTLSADEQMRLIQAAHDGPVWRGLTGPVRAICYRLIFGTGLRHQEIASLKPESFDFDSSPARLRLQVKDSKNRKGADMVIPDDVAEDLRLIVAALPRGSAVFPLKKTTGSKMIQADLKRAGIPFVDEAGKQFDFHSTRAQYATTLDATGATLRTMQTLMRHSTPTLTARYIKPRTSDLEQAALSVPSLRPQGRISEGLAHYLPQAGDASCRDLSADGGVGGFGDPRSKDRKSCPNRHLSPAGGVWREGEASDPDGSRTRAACVKGMCPNH